MQDTYRYHGHSISDPGSTYRTRDEIQGVRRARDPIEHIRTLLLENSFADAGELKKLESQIKAVGSCASLSSQLFPSAAHLLKAYHNFTVALLCTKILLYIGRLAKALHAV